MNSLALRIAIARINATTMWVASVLPAVHREKAYQPLGNPVTPDMP
ncbi:MULTISPECIES: hypothetical protein [Micrococcaceae]|nr:MULTISPECIES: hypothetical protein [Micrococcaceae]MBP2265422.1 hypothetical protein [Pseudarthrobacter sp. PvP004]